VQSSDCNIPGSLDSANSCFFDIAAWWRIWASEAATGKSAVQYTPSITVEESKWALRPANLSDFIEDAKLMATKLLPGEHGVHGRQLYAALQRGGRARFCVMQ
jgi:hypothetical protein